MRYDLRPGSSHVFVRIHAFLHKATASTQAVHGWFEVDSFDDLARRVDGVAEVEVADFEFTNSMIEVAARVWLKERTGSALRFELMAADGPLESATIRGRLTIGDSTRDIATAARVSRSDDHDEVVVEGSWRMSQKEFGLSAPPGVKDAVDVEFRLIGRSTAS